MYLADDAPREIVVGTMVIAPPGSDCDLTPQMFKTALEPGYALAAMNFLVAPDGPNGSLVSTETRVFANSTVAQRKFARYWRIIYPGSALIRRMWLRAVKRRATRSSEAFPSPAPAPANRKRESRSKKADRDP
jgi:hypothetical protein